MGRPTVRSESMCIPIHPSVHTKPPQTHLHHPLDRPGLRAVRDDHADVLRPQRRHPPPAPACLPVPFGTVLLVGVDDRDGRAEEEGEHLFCVGCDSG